MQQAIAILDSGVGGLTVAKEVMRQLPQERVIYFGDTERAPYGPRPAEEVVAFTEQIVSLLLEYHPKMIVIACNTATAAAIDRIRAMAPVPVVGVIQPGARAAVKNTRTGVIGVIGTEGTIRSGAYEKALKELSPQVRVVSLACPQLVPLVEQDMFGTGGCREIVRQSLSPLSGQPLDCLILGCTHYPFLQKDISAVMGDHVELISSAEETAREISAILGHRGQLAKTSAPPEHRFICSGDPQVFRTIAQKWLGQPVTVTPMPWKKEHGIAAMIRE